MSLELFDMSKGEFEPGQSRTAYIEDGAAKAISFLDYSTYEEDGVIGFYVLGGDTEGNALVSYREIDDEYDLDDSQDIIQEIWDEAIEDEESYLPHDYFLNIQYQDADGRRRLVIAHNLGQGVKPHFRHARVEDEHGA